MKRYTKSTYYVAYSFQVHLSTTSLGNKVALAVCTQVITQAPGTIHIGYSKRGPLREPSSVGENEVNRAEVLLLSGMLRFTYEMVSSEPSFLSLTDHSRLCAQLQLQRERDL